ncbi:hypothetical protein [Jiulongibacter sp. NS-SX5]|uniref:hypothetical protein n=1 Tax=Jiulongibacter sp. NS-SX5 TaxID=3463854 RepID=UPI0040585439
MSVRKKPLKFTHQPFLLLKVTPTALLGRDNVFQYGVELAPPFGKFSFGFDYGKGKSSWSLDKEHKALFPDQETKIIRGEIRGYFSDWYPFYALDKKPFGRYYALEYAQKDISYTYRPDVILYGGNTLPSLTELDVATVERAIHVKFGNHFLISKWFFIDTFAGIGVGQYVTQTPDSEVELQNIGFTTNRPPRINNTKGLFLSKTAGIRLCLPI